MADDPQDVEDSSLRPGAIELAAPEKGTRIRLSADMLNRIDWWEFKEKPPCWGVFRQPGELLCAPKALTAQDGRHPFADILEIASVAPEEPVPSWSRIPSARAITAPDRVIAFPAAWTANQKQLSLKIGRDVARRLGWSEGNAPPVYAAGWGRILILMSQRFYDAALRQDLLPPPS